MACYHKSSMASVLASPRLRGSAGRLLTTNRSLQAKRDVHHSGLAIRTNVQPTFLKYLQHRDVVGQDLSDEFLEPIPTGNRGEMVLVHQRCTDTLPLVLVDHVEGHLSFLRVYNDVASAANYHGSAAFFHHCNQGHVVDEVNIQEECDFLLCKAALYREETVIEVLRAGTADGCGEIGPIARSERADFDPAPIARQLNRRIFAGF